MGLTVQTANTNVVNTEYAVRGEIVALANQLKEEGRKVGAEPRARARAPRDER